MVPTRPKIKSVKWASNKKIHRLAIPSQHALAVLPREFGLGDLELHVGIGWSSEQDGEQRAALVD